MTTKDITAASLALNAYLTETGPISRQHALAWLRSYGAEHGVDSVILSTAIKRGEVCESLQDGEFVIEAPGKASV